MRYEDTTLENQILDLGVNPVDNGRSSLVNAQIIHCQLNLCHPRSVYIAYSIVTDSIVHAKREAKRLNWRSVFFRRCRFTGKYFDTRFGTTSALTDVCQQPGGLEDCDFSQAQLHLVTFFNCDPDSIKFPGWPHITTVHPRMNVEDWLAIPFPESFQILQEMLGDFGRRGYVATTIHWPTFAKEEKDTTDPESIRKLLEGKDYIVM